MQAFRDASFTRARAHWARAVELDPGFAAAHLMLGCYFPTSTDDALREMSTAASLRSQLDERDLALLETCQPTREKEDLLTEVGWKRWKALADRFPLDSLIVSTAAFVALYVTDEATSLAWVERARSLDPKSPVSDWMVATYDLDMGRDDAAAAAADRCLAVSPAALACLVIRAQVSQRLGQCAKLEADARTMMARDPSVSDAYGWLAAALVARGAPSESVAEAMRHAREHDPDVKHRSFDEFHDRAVLSALTGDFASVIASFPGFDQSMQHETSTDFVGAALLLESDFFMETGQPDRANAVADAYSKRMPALASAGDPLAGRQVVLLVRRWTGHVSDAEFRATQNALATETWPKYPPKFANGVWFEVYATPAFSAADAREALDALPRYTPLPPYEGNVVNECLMGRVLLLAGRVDEALAHLRRAMSACFSPDSTRSHQYAAELLGEALEAKGDKDGACAAYGEVLLHWGNAKPRSVTADKARAHMKTLGCSK
jgi:serine/threonine-protein kinase